MNTAKQKRDFETQYSTQYSDVNIKCPFFKGANDKKRTVICEGAVDKATRILFSLKQKGRYTRYRRKYCEDDYKSCAYYRAAMEKYIDEAEGE